MKILVTGYKGQLGFDVVNEANARGIEAVGVDIEEKYYSEIEKRLILQRKIYTFIRL